MPSHGYAKVTRTRSCGIVSAARHSCSSGTSTWTPFDSRPAGSASGSSSLRTRSSHGPVAFTIARALTDTRRPSRRATISPPVATLDAKDPNGSTRTLGTDERTQPLARERRVGPEPEPRLDPAVGPVAVEGHEEPKRSDEMRRDDPHQRPPLAMRLPNEPHVPEGQVAQAAVDQLRRSARGGAAEVAPVDERDHETSARSLVRDARVHDP